VFPAGEFWLDAQSDSRRKRRRGPYRCPAVISAKGYGAELLEYVHNWAADNDCVAVELESGLWREDAHRFYLDLDYEKILLLI